MLSDLSAVTYVSGNSAPHAYVEIQDLQGEILALCFADNAGRWSVTVQGAVPWFHVQVDAAQPHRSGFGFDELTHLSPIKVHAGGHGICGHTNVGPGRRVTARIGAQRLVTETASDGTWSIAFDDALEKQLGSGLHHVCVTVSDPQGNEAIVWDTVAVA